ncbi:MAG: polysaccharide pyruvyl transferase family protein [Panacagrimonas sp.]
MSARIGVLIPAGEVYDHDNVRWWTRLDRRTDLEAYHNIGDAFVFDSSLKILDFKSVAPVVISSYDARRAEQINQRFDYLLLRGSNYLHAHMDWMEAARVLEHVRIPIIALGIGAQAATRGALQLSAQSLHVVRQIADRCTSIGVRGAYTAQALHDIGVRNVRIVGCPTAFRRRDPELRIHAPSADAIRKLVFTLRREVNREYTADVRRYLEFQRDLIQTLAARFDDLTLAAQGEVEEKMLLFGDAEQKTRAQQRLNGEPWYSKWFYSARMRDIYARSLWYSDCVADYETLMKSADFVIGYRLHGNLMALANGTPAVYCTYDSRTEEFADTFNIPRIDIYQREPFDLDRLLAPDLFDAFNRGFGGIYAQMRDFLVENGIRHRLDPPSIQVETPPEPVAGVAQTKLADISSTPAVPAYADFLAQVNDVALQSVEAQRWKQRLFEAQKQWPEEPEVQLAAFVALASLALDPGEPDASDPPRPRNPLLHRCEKIIPRLQGWIDAIPEACRAGQRLRTALAAASISMQRQRWRRAVLWLAQATDAFPAAEQAPAAEREHLLHAAFGLALLRLLLGDHRRALKDWERAARLAHAIATTQADPLDHAALQVSREQLRIGQICLAGRARTRIALGEGRDQDRKLARRRILAVQVHRDFAPLDRFADQLLAGEDAKVEAAAE